ncbi:MAG: ATP-binding cassette domain-containing protein [Bacteroidota bacterium]|nr:ATP-binding cassette domain-containing protein [Bacteroidota bacterium]
MIRIENLTFYFDKEKIFKNFSVQIPDNSFVSIIGESGKGKTTLLNLLAGFEIAREGEIYIDDIKLSKGTISDIRKKIAWLPQNFDISINTVKELFMAPFNLKSNKELLPSPAEIKSLFETLNIGNVSFSKNIDEISGGQKQRVIIASLLATKKRYFLLDEPSSALDSKSVEVLLKTLKKENITILASTHDKTVIEASTMVIDLNKL